MSLPKPDRLKSRLRAGVKDIINRTLVPSDVKVANVVALICEAYSKGYTHGHEDAYGQSILPPRSHAHRACGDTPTWDTPILVVELCLLNFGYLVCGQRRTLRPCR